MSFIDNIIFEFLNYNNLDTYLKLYVIIYVDDTVILAEIPRK